MAKLADLTEYIIAPEPKDSYLSTKVTGFDQKGKKIEINVVEERPLTIYLNSQEIVTAMTIGDYPKYLAVGYLLNQKMIQKNDKIVNVDFDKELGVVVVRTDHETNFEEKLKKKIQTSGCAVGTVFGDMLEGLNEVYLPRTKIHTSWMYSLAAKINRTASLYLEAGAIHGTVLCKESCPLVYMEDVGRHNAVDKISGWMFLEKVASEDKILYTTGRLTSEMVIKAAIMGVPILISRSGFTAWGVKLAQRLDLTLIGRLRGQRFTCLSGRDRLIFDVKQ